MQVPDPHRFALQGSSSDDRSQQDNFVEARQPAELVFCIILAAAYAGLARYCWQPLFSSGNWKLFFNVEGFFIIISLLSLLLGLRPYLSPCSLQLSRYGLKYRGPHWLQRKSLTWEQVFRIYISPELIIVLYHPSLKKKSVRPLIIQSVYLADREKIGDCMVRYSSLEPVMISNPGWITKSILALIFLVIVVWIIELLLS